MRDLLQAAWPRGSGAMGCYGSQPIPKSYRVLARASNLVAITPIIKSERQPISAINFHSRNPARLCRHNGTVHRAAANDINFAKPRDPRLRVQRFVRPFFLEGIISRGPSSDETWGEANTKQSKTTTRRMEWRSYQNRHLLCSDDVRQQ